MFAPSLYSHTMAWQSVVQGQLQRERASLPAKEVQAFRESLLQEVGRSTSLPDGKTVDTANSHLNLHVCDGER
jgi:hypothetical protein